MTQYAKLIGENRFMKKKFTIGNVKCARCKGIVDEDSNCIIKCQSISKQFADKEMEMRKRQ